MTWRVQSFDPTGARHELRYFRGENADLNAMKYLRRQLKRYERDGWIFDEGVIVDYDLTLRAFMHDADGLEREFEAEQVNP